MVLIVLLIIGLAMGSFASTIVHRLHIRDTYIFGGRSYCPRCKTTLGCRDLIPLVSFVVNRFRCRFCKTPIAFRYPLLEIIMAGAFVLTSVLVGLNHLPTLLFYLFISFIFVLLAFYDFLFQEVPDSIIVPTILLTIGWTLVAKSMTPASLMIGMAVPIVFFGILFYGSRGRWLGGGDIRIGALMGALLGWPHIIIGLFLGYLLGAIYSLGGILTKRLNRKSQIPFAPFLLGGTYIALFWGKEILRWYLSL